MILIENLIDFGLREKEAKVYVATLELETATANEIAKKSGVNRSSTYVVIESLKRRGFVNMTEDKLVKHYVAASPEILLNFAEKTANKQVGIKTMMESILPDLKALHKDTKHKPKVFVYEGKENMKALYYKELSLKLKSNDNWRTYEDLAEIEKYLPGFLDTDSAERKQRGVKLFGINPDTKENRDDLEKNKNIQYQDINLLIPLNKFKSLKQSINFAVYGDEIVFSSLQQSFAIVIKQQEIADTLKNVFDLAWKEAERIGKKY